VSLSFIQIHFLPALAIKIHHQQKSPHSPKIGGQGLCTSLETVIFLLSEAVFRGFANLCLEKNQTPL
jgi:hypothetical protein